MDVSRYLNTKKLKFTVDFITPAFLGGADGEAEIRPAPFKNLLRRWWRIVITAKENLSPEDLWEQESRLFGSTEKDDNDEIFGKSKVMLTIDSIYKKPEVQAAVGKDGKPVAVKAVNNTPYIPVETNILTKEKTLKKYLYLGYGPVQPKAADCKDYIKPDTQVDFTLTIPASEEETFINVLTLINLFGSIGSRSKKGFGSIGITAKLSDDSAEYKLKNLKKLQESLPNLVRTVNYKSDNRHYPYCIGQDENGMSCWNMKTDRNFSFSSWEGVLDCFQDIYKYDLREFQSPNPVIKKIQNGRKILGSAETIPGCNDIERLPSQLIFKVARQGESNSNYAGKIIHLPYNIDSKLTTQSEVWAKVYKKLDKKQNPDHKDKKLFGRLGGGKK